MFICWRRCLLLKKVFTSTEKCKYIYYIVLCICVFFGLYKPYLCGDNIEPEKGNSYIQTGKIMAAHLYSSNTLPEIPLIQSYYSSDYPINTNIC